MLICVFCTVFATTSHTEVAVHTSVVPRKAILLNLKILAGYVYEYAKVIGGREYIMNGEYPYPSDAVAAQNKIAETQFSKS